MCRTHKDEYKKTFRSSFCLRVSQVFELSGLFLPSTVVPHAFRREASCLLTERYHHHLNELRGKQQREYIFMDCEGEFVLLFFISNLHEAYTPTLFPSPCPTPQHALLSAALSTGIEFEPRRQFADM